MTKMYDNLMRSGKFTAAQNKAESGEFVDSIGELVALCERDGFIPRYYTDGPQDKIDRVLQDMQQYTKDLIVEEAGLGSLIERAMQQIENERESLKNNAGEVSAEKEEDALFNYSDQSPLSDQDFIDLENFEKELSDIDDQLLLELMNS